MLSSSNKFTSLIGTGDLTVVFFVGVALSLVGDNVACFGFDVAAVGGWRLVDVFGLSGCFALGFDAASFCLLLEVAGDAAVVIFVGIFK